MNQIVEKSAVKDAVRAAEALGIMGAMAEEAIPALIQAEQHKSLEVRQEAAKALTKIYAAIEELD